MRVISFYASQVLARRLARAVVLRLRHEAGRRWTIKMMQKTEEYDHNQVIGWLRKRFSSEKVYPTLEASPEFQADVEATKKKQDIFIYPGLPIDLVRVSEKPEKTDEGQNGEGTTDESREATFYYYTLVFVVCSEKTLAESWDKLKERWLFYQFYLSRISEQKRFEITVVIPHYAEMSKDHLRFFQESGIGLWKVDIQRDKEEIVHESRSLRDRMIEEFKESVDNPKNLGEAVEKICKESGLDNIPPMREAIKEKTAEDFTIFFDQYIIEAVDAIAGATPEKFGRRYIDRTLLYCTLELKKVSYAEKLRRLVNEHLDEKGDDYEFVAEVFSQLWEEEIGIRYSRFLENFEPALLHVFAEKKEAQEKYYRDHYIHQFQVFLLGLYIIDSFYDDLEKYKCRKPEIGWLVTSSFHDMAYPVQLYDEWSGEFFRKVFNVDVKLAQLELKSGFVDQSLLSCMGHLICSLHRVKWGTTIEGNWPENQKELVHFFYRKITEKKGHCVLSSLSLLKLVNALGFDEKNTISKRLSDGACSFDEILNMVFVPSALAIALHDQDVWQELRCEGLAECPPKILSCVEFEKDPLTFLLILCDTIQEWGRPSKSQSQKKNNRSRPQQEDDRESHFSLESIFRSDSDKRIEITLRSPKHTRRKPVFAHKLDELRTMESFLRQPTDTHFVVHLKDKNDDGESFEMRGLTS